ASRPTFRRRRQTRARGGRCEHTAARWQRGNRSHFRSEIIVARPHIHGGRYLQGGRPPALGEVWLAEVSWYSPTSPRGAGGGFRRSLLLMAGPWVRPRFGGAFLKNKDL